jgi:hypothetical protein
MARLSEWRIAVGLMVHFAVLVHNAHFARAQPGSLLRTTQFLGGVMCLAHDTITWLKLGDRGLASSPLIIYLV